MQTGYIYKFHNKVTNKDYIGQTVRTLNERIGEHLYDASHNKDNNYFHNALNKYGIENFEISIIHTVDAPNKKLLLEKLNLLEIQEIENYNSFNNGYNSHQGGFNHNTSEFTKQNISNACKGRIFSDEHRKNLSIALKGCKKAKEVQNIEKKISKSHENRTYEYLRTPESIKKATAKKIGQKRSEETKQRMSKAQKGRKVSAQTREKLRQIALKQWIEKKQKLQLNKSSNKISIGGN